MSDRWPALMSVKQAAEYLSTSEATVRRLKANGEIKSVRLRGDVKYRRYDLDKFIDKLPEGSGEFRGKAEANAS